MRVFSAKEYSRNLKATIQNSGRLGFTSETSAELELDTHRYVKLATDDEDGVLYLAAQEDADEDAFNVCSAGNYYYIPTRNLFDAIGYDYTRRKIMFDIVRRPDLDEELGGKSYMLKRRYGKDK